MKYVYLYNIIFYNLCYDCFYSIYIKAFIWIHITHASPAILSHLYVWIGITQHKKNLILNSLMKILYSPHYIIPFHLNASYIILCTEFFKDTWMLFIWKTNGNIKIPDKSLYNSRVIITNTIKNIFFPNLHNIFCNLDIIYCFLKFILIFKTSTANSIKLSLSVIKKFDDTFFNL